MNVDAINRVLHDEQLNEMVVQSFHMRGRKLVIAFLCEGGPREDDAFVVEFNEAIIFHLPSALRARAFFRCAHDAERERLIPSVSYDPAEVSGARNAYTVVVLDDASGTPHGYYLAADSVSASWRRRRDLLDAQG